MGQVRCLSAHAEEGTSVEIDAVSSGHYLVLSVNVSFAFAFALSGDDGNVSSSQLYSAISSYCCILGRGLLTRKFRAFELALLGSQIKKQRTLAPGNSGTSERPCYIRRT
jgi:hypothetical protein